MKNNMKSRVAIMANKLVGQGWSRSMAMVKSWVIVKAGQLESKVAGISLPNRQRAAERLTHYTPDSIKVTLQRDYNNEHDNNAVAVMVSVNGSASYQVGYLPKGLAIYIAPLMDAGKAVKSVFKAIKGGYTSWANYGIEIEVVV